MMTAGEDGAVDNPDIIMENGKPKKETIATLAIKLNEFITHTNARLDQLEASLQIVKKAMPLLAITSHAFTDEDVNILRAELS